MIQEREWMARHVAIRPVNRLVIYRPRVEDCKPGDVIEVDGLSGTHLLAWSRHGLLLVSSEDAFALPAESYLEKECRFIRSVIAAKTL